MQAKLGAARVNALYFFWAHHRFALLAACLGLFALLVFGGMATRQAIYWNDPGHRQQPLEPWMTPRYVARSYGLPPETMRTLLQLGEQPGTRQPTISAIAAEMGLSLPQLQDIVKTASDEHRAQIRARAK